jgi:hypothetical protein
MALVTVFSIGPGGVCLVGVGGEDREILERSSGWGSGALVGPHPGPHPDPPGKGVIVAGRWTA